LERAYTSLIERDAPGTKHKFKSVSLPSAACGRDLKLDKAAYKPKYQDAPKALKEITSLKQSTSWPSHKAEHWSCPYVDQVLIHNAKVQHETRLLGNAWLGEFLNPTCELVIRPTHTDERRWFLPLGHLHDSAVIAWPLEEYKVVGSTRSFFVVKRHVQYRELYQAVLDHSKWKAYRIEWASSYTQMHAFGGACGTYGGVAKGLGIRPLTISMELSLLGAAALNAFGTTNKTWLTRLAKHLGVAFESNTLLGVLEALVLYLVVPCPTADELVDILALRIHKNAHRENDAIQSFLDVEDSHLCFTHEDYENFTKAKDQCRTRQTDADDYHAEWTAKKVARAEAKKAALPKAKAKGKGKGKGAKAVDAVEVPLVLPVGDLTQPQLKPLVPTGGFIWIGNTRGTWNSHFPPFERVSYPWHLCGHRAAAVLVLRDLWLKYYKVNVDAGTINNCPIVGLFKEDGLAALPS
jgi:hypothetical protein